MAAALAAALLAVATPTPAAGPGQATEAQLLALHQEIFEAAILRNDRDPLRRAALDALLIVPPGGIVEDLAHTLSGSGAFAVDAMSVTDERVLLQGDTAVVVARLALDGEVAGRQPPPLRTMTVFARTDGAWRLLARSVTPCSERALAAGRC